MCMTHEAYIAAVKEIAKARLPEEARAKLDAIKLVYGAGAPGLRGVTYFNLWGKEEERAPFVEICAFGQDKENRAQIAGTTIHELGHVLAGPQAGHGKEWKDACALLGLRRIKAAGTNYLWCMFAPDIREAIARLPRPDEGEPALDLSALLGGAKPPKPCQQGVGTRGGKSRGKGSGSRLRLWECGCEPPVKVRASRDLDMTCNCCGSALHRV